MKRDVPPAPLTPLADRLKKPRAGAPAQGWLSGGDRPAPSPLFTSSLIDEEEVERRLSEALARVRTDAEREGRAQAQAEIAPVIARLGEAISQVQLTAREMARPYANELVELALIIARVLIGAEVARDPAPLISLVERCLDDVAGEASITIRLHPADRAALLAARPDLVTDDVRILEDASLARGGCSVESARRLIDARVEERLDKVRDGLRDLLEEAERADA